jgi:hypothetical protein
VVLAIRPLRFLRVVAPAQSAPRTWIGLALSQALARATRQRVAIVIGVLEL